MHGVTLSHGVRRSRSVLLMLAAVSAGAADPLFGQDTQPPLVIRNVAVIPMDSERVLPDHTVVIRAGRIASVGPAAEVAIPSDARVVDGTGRYLIPGLVDMHIHVVGGTGEDGDGAWQQMALLVANGVTTARSLAGAPTAPAVRDAIIAGRLTGPRLYLAGASLNQNSVSTPQQARAEVQKQADAGFDFLKTHGVSSDVYDAIVESAAERGVRLVGHVTPEYGLERALRSGQQIEHLDGYLAATVPSAAGVEIPPGQLYFGSELDHMNEEAMGALAARTAALGVWNSPTLALFEIVATPMPVEEYLAWPEMRYVPENARSAWAGQIAEVSAIPATPERRERYLELRRAMTRALRDAGAGIMAGSDSPQLFMAPGFALHHELRALQRAGLTPYEALAAATSGPARYIGADFGVVDVGNAADLLMLDRNPLEDVSHASAIHGLVLRGEWWSSADLDGLKEKVLEAVTPAGVEK